MSVLDQLLTHLGALNDPEDGDVTTTPKTGDTGVTNKPNVGLETFSTVEYLYQNHWMSPEVVAMFRKVSRDTRSLVDKLPRKVTVSHLWFLSQRKNVKILCDHLKSFQQKHPIKILIMKDIEITNVEDIQLLIETLQELKTLTELDLSNTQLFRKLSPKNNRHVTHAYDPGFERIKVTRNEEQKKEHKQKMAKISDVKKMLFELFKTSNELTSLNLRKTLMTDADCIIIVKNVQNNLNLDLNITENGDESHDYTLKSYDLDSSDIFVSSTTYDELLELWKGDLNKLHVSRQFRFSWTDSDEIDSEDSDFDAADGAANYGRN